MLFHLEDLSLEECAEVLAVPVETVKSRLHRARDRHLDRLRFRSTACGRTGACRSRCARRPVRPRDAGRCPLHRRAEETIGATVKPIGPLAIALRRFGSKRAGIAIAALLIVLLVVGLLI
ncbi:sigma factor-like helix-turn-helix DNA-binding protein [Kribbella rubisoli]|uniref:sigma factor-like helix-turn-helix DNA-binding protein n=1 Tax=Kribbella rubisoli TaxID=3075929 RepID=UPI003BB09A88